ncbi:hypothetical protein AAEX63_04265 [Luteococcus sp. H138]|uniref:hypothetical protein n=1 Tax=unclassified Luteococcus TaxID=2639923 RepID=UPI00313B6C99
MQAVTGNVVGFTLLAGAAVVASTAGLVVRCRAREHALWKAVGRSPASRGGWPAAPHGCGPPPRRR